MLAVVRMHSESTDWRMHRNRPPKTYRLREIWLGCRSSKNLENFQRHELDDFGSERGDKWVNRSSGDQLERLKKNEKELNILSICNNVIV